MVNIITDADLARVHGLSGREAARVLGVSKTSVNDARAEARVRGVLAPVARTNQDGPAWPVIQPARAVQINLTFPQVTPAEESEWKTAIILPDPQIGFRKFEDGTHDPFHDERAMSVALQIIDWERFHGGVDQDRDWETSD